jgi:hypothetical protein
MYEEESENAYCLGHFRNWAMTHFYSLKILNFEMVFRLCENQCGYKPQVYLNNTIVLTVHICRQHKTLRLYGEK